MDVVIEMVPWMSHEQVDLLGDYLIGVLDELGYRGRVQPASDDDFYGSRTSSRWRSMHGAGTTRPPRTSSAPS